MEPRIWLIAGPTASGKSALALRLAAASGAEIVNADSMQLYADLRLITARPSPAEEAKAPHHLFGIADAAELWSTGRWRDAAKGVLAEIEGRGRPAIVVGGTGLYFRALTYGLADTPAVDPGIRDLVRASYDEIGEAEFRKTLARLDHKSEARIASGDRQRLMRALEVILATGQPLRVWELESTPVIAPGAWNAIVIEPPRAALYARCDGRFDTMLEQGALDEVRRLLGRKLDHWLPAMKALGVGALEAYLDGRISQDRAVELAKQQTRNYAKRQLTWFRNQTPDWPRLTETDAEGQWRQFLALNPALTP